MKLQFTRPLAVARGVKARLLAGQERLRKRHRQLGSACSWRLTAEPVQGHAARVLNDLKRDGIAMTSVDELPLDTPFDELQEACRELSQNAPQACAYKDYFQELLGRGTLEVTRDDVFFKSALSTPLLQIANNYLRCFSRLHYYNVWLNVPTGDEPKASQLWHRDPGDTTFVRMFVVIEDLTPENGPFSYIPGSHKWGDRASMIAPSTHDGHSERSDDDQMRTVVPESEWITPLGPAGTIIMADTRGYHKGGFVRCGRRLLFCLRFNRWVHSWPAAVSVDRRLFTGANRAVRWAVRP